MRVGSTYETREITFFVCGIPETQGSKTWLPSKSRFIDAGNVGVKGKRRGGRLLAWRSAVAKAGMVARLENDWTMRDRQAILLGLEFYLPRAKGNKDPEPVTGKDLCKLARAVEDALQGIFYPNDNRIVRYGNLGKQFADEMGPGAMITVSPFIR